MKNKKLLLVSIALTAVLAVNVGLYIGLNKKPVEEVNAYDSTSLPTTIDLNDCSEQKIRSYYSNLNSLAVSERKGTNLLKNLKPILSNGQNYFSYENGTNVWRMYEITDRDWEKSPASGTTYGTYNVNTNTITNYQYGNSNSDGKNNPYIHALYINRNIENETLAWGNHNQDAWGINREHIWAKSHGFDTEGAGGARGDPMHLWAANGWANHEHSNYFFAFVDKTRTYSDAGNKYNTIYNNLTGYSKNAGGSETVFEPQDCDKGDIARSIFYMVARYNNYAGDDNNIDTDNPNLVLLNDLSENSRTGTSSANNPYGMGLLSDLLAWNKLDPVDEYERHRNNLLYNNYTNNRNPFIDFPNWADAIWGTVDLDGTNYNSSLNTYARPDLDPIGSSNSNVFAISSSSLDIEPDDTAEIYATNAEGNITWTVGDNTVISLDKNTSSNNEVVTITALKEGSTTLTATNSGNSLTCQITVRRNPNGSLRHPLTISEAKQIIDDNNGALTSEMMYVEGIVSSNSAYNTTYNNFDNVWLQSEDGVTPQAFDLYRVKLDQSINDDYSAENSMQNYRVIAYGYGKRYNTTYELAPNTNNSENPIILSITPVNTPEKTPRELIEEKETTTSLAYRYEKQESTLTDTLNFSKIGISGTTYTDWSNKTDTSNATYAGNSAGGNSSIQLRKSSDNQLKSAIVSTTSGGKIKKVTVAWNSNTAANRTLNVYGKNTAYSSASDLYNDSNKGTLLGTIVNGTSTELVINDDYAYVGVISNSGAMYLDSLSFDWSSASSFNIVRAGIRFTGQLSVSLWNSLNTESTIEGYGVLLSDSDFLGNDELKDYYELADGVSVKDFYRPLSQKSHPDITNEGQDYIWSLFKNVTSENFKKVYVVVAYIKTTSGVIFFNQVEASVKSIASSLISSGIYNRGSHGGSVYYLANLT